MSLVLLWKMEDGGTTASIIRNHKSSTVTLLATCFVLGISSSYIFGQLACWKRMVAVDPMVKGFDDDASFCCDGYMQQPHI